MFVLAFEDVADMPKKKKMKCDFSYKLYAYDFDFDVMGID